MINEGIVKINSKMLEPHELKRLDKQEKENIQATAATVKGKTEVYFFFVLELLRILGLHINLLKGFWLITSSRSPIG